MNPEQTELMELLNRTHEKLIEMSDLLNTESQSLQSRNIEGIMSVANHKRELADSINALTARQRSLLEQLGFSADRSGMEACLSQLGSEAADGKDSPQERWQALLKITSECHHQNEVNGSFVGLLERYVEASLDLIAGSPSQTETYSPKGSKSRAALSRRSFRV